MTRSFTPSRNPMPPMKPLLLAAALMLAAPVAGAQSMPEWASPSYTPPPPGPTPMATPGVPGGGGPVTQTPVDGGLGLLALAGGAYAVRRLRQRD